MNITESIKFDKLQEENEKLKKELEELQQTQLYKEDFEKVTCLWEKSNLCCENGITFYLKDNSIYDTLPSKDVK